MTAAIDANTFINKMINEIFLIMEHHGICVYTEFICKTNITTGKVPLDRIFTVCNHKYAKYKLNHMRHILNDVYRAWNKLWEIHWNVLPFG